MKNYILRLIILVVCQCVFISMGYSQVNQTKENERQILAASVAYLLDSGQEKEALRLAKTFLKKYPNDPEGFRQFGIIKIFNNDSVGAINEFEKAFQSHEDEIEKSIDLYLIAKAWSLDAANENVIDTLKRMNAIEITQSYVKRALSKYQQDQSLPILNKDYLVKRKVASFPSAINQSQTTSPESVTSGSEGSGPNGSLALVYGLDTNPIFVPDGSQSRNDAASTFSSMTINKSWKGSFQGQLIHTISLGTSIYFKEIAQSFNNFRWSYATGLEPSSDWFKENKVSFSNSFEQSYQTENGFNYFFSADTLSMNKIIAKESDNEWGLLFKLGYRSYANKDLTDTTNDRSGGSFGAGANAKTTVYDLPVMASVGINKQLTNGQKFDTNSYDGVINLQQMAFRSYEVLYGLGITLMDYPNNPDKKTDINTSLGLEISHALESFKGWSAKWSLSRAQNKSDAADSNFTQDNFSLWMNYDLF